MLNKRNQGSSYDSSFKIGVIPDKRGQVTIFVIIAIILIASLSLYFIFGNLNDSKETDYVEGLPVYTFVEECLETTSKQTLYFIGLHGGYFIPPEKSTDNGVPYYIYLGDSFLPSINQIEREISSFIESSLILCVDNFKEFNDFEINQGSIETRTNIKEEVVSIKINYPLTIEKEGSVSRIEEFEVEIPIRLNVLYDASKFIIDNHFENFGNLCLSCLMDYQEENSLQINMVDDENTIVYEIVDLSSILEIKAGEFEPENYKFRFAIKY